MTLIELIDEVWEKTHVDRVEILLRVEEAWPEGRSYFTGTQCALVVRAVGMATPSPKRCAALRGFKDV